MSIMPLRVRRRSPLLEKLDFTRGNRNWGYQMRFGLFEISQADFHTIAEAMGAEL